MIVGNYGKGLKYNEMIKKVRQETLKEVIRLIDKRLTLLLKVLIGKDYTQATYELNKLKKELEEEELK